MKSQRRAIKIKTQRTRYKEDTNELGVRTTKGKVKNINNKTSTSGFGDRDAFSGYSQSSLIQGK